MSEKEYISEGYLFATKKEADLASAEAARIKTLNEKIDYSNYNAVLSLYRKATQNHVFVTPVGIGYLAHLQAILEENHLIDAQKEPIPVDSSVSVGEEYQRIREDAEVSVEAMQRSTQRKLEQEEQKIKRLQNRVAQFAICSVVLFGMVILMFVITLTSKNENILNYKRVITNSYSSWEEELSEREQVIREKEKELGISTESELNNSEEE